MHQPVSADNIQAQIRHAEQAVDRGKTLHRLMAHPDFKDLVLGHYLQEFALDQTYALTNPATQDEKSQKRLFRNLEGIAVFREFLTRVEQGAELAEAELPRLEAEKDYLEVENG